MADHVRQQIREAAATALTGLVTTGTNVKQSRVYPLQDADLPGLRIFTTEEESEPATLGRGSSRGFERNLNLMVEGVTKATANLDDTLDLIAKEVEVALAADVTLGGKCRDLWLSGTEIDLGGDGEKPLGIIKMTFRVDYFTTQGAPDVSI